MNRPRVTTLTLDRLNESQRTRLNKLLELLGRPGVPVNVLVGEESWDIRPLVLENGNVMIYRPIARSHERGAAVIASELSRFSNSGLSDFSLLEVQGGELFIKREYVSNTLASAERESLVTLLEISKSICSIGLRLEQEGLIHGHIIAANIVRRDNDREKELLLLDPIVGSLSKANIDQAGFAAELAEADPSYATDRFGIAYTIDQLIGSDLSRTQREILRLMQDKNPQSRPGLAELIESLEGRQNHPKKPLVLASTRPHDSSSSAIPVNEKHLELKTSPLKLGIPAWCKNTLIGAGAVIALALLTRSRFPEVSYRVERILPFTLFGDREELESWLDSGDSVRIREATRKAVTGYSLLAEDLITERVLSGSNLSGFNNQLLRVAHNPLWERELGIAGRRAAFLLASVPLIGDAVAQLPALKDLHPGVILAVLSNMNFDNPSEQLKLISLKVFGELPDPVGGAFLRLSELGVKTVADKPALALAAIVGGNREVRAIEAIFDDTSDLRVVLPKVEILAPFFSQSDQLAQDIFSFLRDSDGLTAQALGWFAIERSAAWDKVPAGIKLETLFGRFPKANLTFEQLADLLLFPLPVIRGEAKKRLLERYLGAANSAVADYLGSDDNRLTRTQNILLAATLYAKAGTEGPFVSRWFDLNPPANCVATILLARDKFPPTDLFNFEAARYLKRSSWNAPPEVLAKLAAHPDTLARSIAYAKLNPMIEVERLILEERVKVEKEKNLKSELERRLTPSSIP